jgi:ABC-type transport system involved in Fe-S cluster assembly fused permease/ATPase subunit
MESLASLARICKDTRVIAHHLRTIRAAYEILVFDKGKEAECGRHQDLLAKGGLYTSLWEAQEKAGGWKL